MEKVSSRDVKNLRQKKRKTPNSIQPNEVLLGELRNAEHINVGNFSSEIKKIANKTGHKFLFDVPRILMDQKNGFVAALLSFHNEKPTLCFVTVSNSQKSTHLVEQSKAPKQLVNFAWSFANVIMLVGKLEDLNQTKKLTAS